ncbi:MAG: hypothetical protein KJ968_05355 [Nanoarchaeota archaeon]|nr:hypothetical protein [Nanoarchaeota archaeon]MBU4284510.1 hypothetical protein [Nanoarchaeota archaeon]
MPLIIESLDSCLNYEDIIRLDKVIKILKNPENLIKSIKDNFGINICSESEYGAYIFFDTMKNLVYNHNKDIFFVEYDQETKDSFKKGMRNGNRWNFKDYYKNGKTIMDENKSIAAFFDIDKENLLPYIINIPLNPKQLEEKIGDCYKNIEKNSSIEGVPKKINNISTPIYLLSEKYPGLISGELGGNDCNIIQGGKIIYKKDSEKVNVVKSPLPMIPDISFALQ